MGYSKDNVSRITALVSEIQGRKEHERAAATYRDVPALKEIEGIVMDNLARYSDKDTLTDSIAALRFLAEAYRGMGRMALCATFYGEILELATVLKGTYKVKTEDISDIFYSALRARNYYVDDDCDDLVKNAVTLMPEEAVYSMLEERRARRRTLRSDPVEMTDEYLRVIDEVEEKIDATRKTFGHGSCYEVWMLKREYLAERGIKWSSPAELNPKFRFD